MDITIIATSDSDCGIERFAYLQFDIRAVIGGSAASTATLRCAH